MKKKCLHVSIFDRSADLQDNDTCSSRSRLKVAAVKSPREITNLSMRMRLDTSWPKGHYKNPGALWDGVILASCVWPFVYQRHITRDPLLNTNTEQNHERKFLPQGNTQGPPSPADHSGQLRAEGQEGFLLSALRNGSRFKRAAWHRFDFPLFVSPPCVSPAEEVCQVEGRPRAVLCKGWKSHFPKDVISLEKHWPQKDYKKNIN